MRRVFLILLILLCVPRYATAQLSAENGSVSPFDSMPLRAVHFPDTVHGWAVGDGGLILHSPDGGATWTAQASGTALDLRDVYFVDAATGWVVGGFPGVVLHTADGGATWTMQRGDLADQLVAVHFLDSRNGWAAGLETVLQTTDGGRSWLLQAGPVTGNTGSAVKGLPAPEGVTKFALGHNYPNPFNPMTTIRFSLPTSEHVRLDVFDVQGRRIETLVDETLDAGSYGVTWNAQAVPSGVYFYRMAAASFTAMGRMILMR